MNTEHKKIAQHLENGHNILLYKEDLYVIYKSIKTGNNSVYISTPKKGKTAYEQILKATDKNANTKNKTISTLLEEILKNADEKSICIFIDNFQQLTKRELDNYRQLIIDDNILFVANMTEDRQFIDEKLLDNFIIANGEYLSLRSQSINISYAMLLLLSFLVFLLFLRIQLTAIRYIISGLWFTLLMYRSIYYISR